MGQARISILENPNYENLSLNTLKRIANVFDVALMVRFVPFSKLLITIDNETSETLTVPSFAQEFGTENEPITTPNDKVVEMYDFLKKRTGQSPLRDIPAPPLQGQPARDGRNPLSKVR